MVNDEVQLGSSINAAARKLNFLRDDVLLDLVRCTIGGSGANRGIQFTLGKHVPRF